jgi:hypothetical protein
MAVQMTAADDSRKANCRTPSVRNRFNIGASMSINRNVVDDSIICLQTVKPAIVSRPTFTQNSTAASRNQPADATRTVLAVSSNRQMNRNSTKRLTSSSFGCRFRNIRSANDGLQYPITAAPQPLKTANADVYLKQAASDMIFASIDDSASVDTDLSDGGFFVGTSSSGKPTVGIAEPERRQNKL